MKAVDWSMYGCFLYVRITGMYVLFLLCFFLLLHSLLHPAIIVSHKHLNLLVFLLYIHLATVGNVGDGKNRMEAGRG